MKTTYKQFSKMSPIEKQVAYFGDENNQRKNERGQSGPSIQAQSAFYNNWRKAFDDFAAKLSSK